jgi:hypothetical protein
MGGLGLSRRGVMRLGAAGLAMASAGGGAASAQAVQAAASRPFLSDNEMWEAFGGRPLGRV